MFDKILVKSVEDLTFLKELINNAIIDDLFKDMLSEYNFLINANSVDQVDLQDIGLSSLRKDGKYFTLAVPKSFFSYVSDFLSEYVLGNAAFVFIYDIMDEVNLNSEGSQFINENLTIYLKEVLLSKEITQIKTEISNRFISYTKYSNTINLSGFIVFMLSDCMQKLYEILYSALVIYM